MIPHLVRTAAHRSTTTAQSLALAVAPHGGQRSSRRNAWASMSEDAVRARGRREAEAALGRTGTGADRLAAH